MPDKIVLDLLHEFFNSSSILMPGVSELKTFTGEDDINSAIKKFSQTPILKFLFLKKAQKIGELLPELGTPPISGLWREKLALIQSEK